MIVLSKKNVYLSGPMTNVINYNVPAFAEAHAVLKQMGAERIYDPAMEWLNEPNAEAHDHEHYMRKCIGELIRIDSDRKLLYDMLVLLDGWKESDGCLTEVNVANACGIPCVEFFKIVNKNDFEGPCECCHGEGVAEAIWQGAFMSALARDISEAVAETFGDDDED